MLNPVKNLMKDNELEGSVSVISDEITITGTVSSSGNLIINGNVDVSRCLNSHNLLRISALINECHP